MTHLLKWVERPRDPDARAIAWSYCGEAMECSGSGRHVMTDYASQADCPACRRVAGGQELVLVEQEVD